MPRLLARCALALACLLATGSALAGPAIGSQRIYVTDFNTGDVVVAPVEEGAIGTPLTPNATSGGTSNEGVTLTPNGTRLFTGDVSGSTIAGFAVAAGDGALSAPAPTPTAYGSGVVASPNGRFLYQAAGGSVYGFNLASDGSVSGAITGSPFSVTDFPNGLAVTSDGRFLYTANAASSTVGAFAIAADGSLAELSGSPYASADSPYAISLTPDGEHLYVPGRNGSPQQVFGYDIAANGSLSAAPGSPVDMNGGVGNSFGSTVTADGGYFFTANYGTGDVSGFSIAPSGALTELAGSPYAVGGAGAAVTSDADGSHVYVSNGSLTEVAVLSLTAPGGPAEQIDGSPFEVGVSGDFQSVALSPNQPPAAALTQTRSGKAVTFNAFGSTDDGVIATYAYDFGDGSTLETTSPSPTHTYNQAGTYTATVTETDEEGCSTTYVAAGQTAYCNGGPGATASVTFEIPATDRSKPKFKVKAKKPQKLGKPLKLKVSSASGVRVTSNNAKVKLKGGKKKGIRYRPAAVTIGQSGKAKLKLGIGRRAARIAKDARSGKVKVRLTAANNFGTTTETFKLKLK